MSADEFETIAKLFAPLARDAGARGLIDDAALFAGHVVTTDAIVEGVHFRPDDPIDTVAKKALRVNLSDLAAKGARPAAALLTLIWPDARPSAQIAEFARGLGEDLARYEVALLGGDTTSTPGPLTVSVTAFGVPCGARTPSRADARPGQDIWVTGTIGDAVLGLTALNKGVADVRVTERYLLPEPRVGFAETIARFAAASMDVSDGLAQDAGKIAAASGVALRIEADRVPRSEAGRDADIAVLVSGGDDYEILFTAEPASRAGIEAAARGAGLAVSRIGVVEAGEGARILGPDGTPVPLAGYRHRLGR